MLYVSEGCQPSNRLYYLDLNELPKQPDTAAFDFKEYNFHSGSKKLPIVKLVDNFDASYDYVANDGDTFYFKTNLDAPRYR